MGQELKKVERNGIHRASARWGVVPHPQYHVGARESVTKIFFLHLGRAVPPACVLRGSIESEPASERSPLCKRAIFRKGIAWAILTIQN